MPYYHVTNKDAVAAFGEYQTRKYQQRLACDVVLKALRVKDCLLDDMGLLAIRCVAGNQRNRFSDEIWCPYDKRRYGRLVIRPRLNVRAAFDARGLFNSVPPISDMEVRRALNCRWVEFFPSPFKDGTFIIYLDPRRAGGLKFPDGVKEATNKELVEWQKM